LAPGFRKAYLGTGILFLLLLLAVHLSLFPGTAAYEIASLTDRSGSVVAMCFSPDGQIVFSAGTDTTIRCWDIEEKRVSRSFNGHSAGVTCLAVNSDGSLLFSGSLDGHVKVWDLANGGEYRGPALSQQSYRALRSWGREVIALTIHPSGTHLAVVLRGGSVQSLELETGRVTDVLRQKHQENGFVSFSSDGRLLLFSGAADGTVRVRNMVTQTETVISDRHRDVLCSSLLPSRRLVATGTDDGAVRLWDPDSGTLVHVLDVDGYCVSAMAASSDGRYLAVNSRVNGNFVSLWDLSSYRLVKSFDAHRTPISALAFSPDGKVLASACFDASVDDRPGYGGMKLWQIGEAR